MIRIFWLEESVRTDEARNLDPGEKAEEAFRLMKLSKALDLRPYFNINHVANDNCTKAAR